MPTKSPWPMIRPVELYQGKRDSTAYQSTLASDSGARPWSKSGRDSTIHSQAHTHRFPEHLGLTWSSADSEPSLTWTWHDRPRTNSCPHHGAQNINQNGYNWSSIISTLSPTRQGEFKLKWMWSMIHRLNSFPRSDRGSLNHKWVDVIGHPSPNSALDPTWRV